MTASKIFIYMVIPDCVPEKVAYLKERAGTLLIVDHPQPTTLNRKKGTLQIGLIASHLTVIALSIPYSSFVTSGRFPVARAFSQCTEPQRGRC